MPPKLQKLSNGGDLSGALAAFIGFGPRHRLQQIEDLEPAEKRQVLQVLDAFIERGRLKKKVG